MFFVHSTKIGTKPGVLIIYPWLALESSVMAEHTSLLIRALCVTFIHGDNGHELINKIDRLTDWSDFVATANEHRLLPLAYWTFKRLEIQIPESVNRLMASAYLRQKFIAKTQIAALLQALDALSKNGIEAVVLKGGILANKLYPEPGLRPMDDLDILVSPNMVMRARDVLISLGYHLPLPISRFDRTKHHLPIAIREDAGVTIGIELHSEAFHWYLHEPLDFSHLERPLARFEIQGIAVAYLGEASLLWMQYRGLRKFQEPLRKLHLIDIALMAERLPNHWQGPSLRTTRPELWNALVALDIYLPLSDHARQFLGIFSSHRNSDRMKLVDDFRGWPLMSTSSSLVDWRQIVWPSRTWANFFYGLSNNSSRWNIQNTHIRMCTRQVVLRIQAYQRRAQPYLMAAPSSAPRVHNQSTLLVTCMYNGLAGSRYGGRLNRDAFYRESLATIARASQLPILCFVSAEELESHQRFFASRPHQITWATFELAEFPHSNDIQRIKSQEFERYSSIEWQERCVEIMWGKFHLLAKAMAHYPNTENFFWIDAGLANTSVISTKYTSAQALQEGDFHRVDSAFSSALFSKILTVAKDRVMGISATSPHNRPIPEHYNERPYVNYHGLIGGLFGGSQKSMQTLCDLFEEKCKKILLSERLYFEESIMSGVFADHPELFELFTFDCWYHEGWEFYDPKKINFSQFFDLMLGTPPVVNPLKLPLT